MKFIKDYIKNLDLRSQLVYIAIFSLFVSFISLIIILPRLLTPFYEKNIYELLNQPLSFIEGDTNNTSSSIAYIVTTNDNVYVSSNFMDYFNRKDVNFILSIANENRGKFKLNDKTYYYNTTNRIEERVITLTNDAYIISQRKTLSLIIFPVIAMTLIIIALALIIWGSKLVNKISKIKDKIDNLDNKEYNHTYKFEINDELNSLINSVEYMRKEISEKEEYKNNMFQNISHELKTPISVISSYVEAANDKVVTYKEAISTIDSEIKTLTNDVNMILELNKLNYLKDTKKNKDEVVDITKLLKELLKKYKIQRKDVKWTIEMEKENILRGTEDIWKVIIDNIFGNFVRYANSSIKVTIRDNKIMFYNDGEKIDDALIKDIFVQYKKGIKGKFGLGLSIVKQSLSLYDYNISVSNQEKGVLFEIK